MNSAWVLTHQQHAIVRTASLRLSTRTITRTNTCKTITVRVPLPLTLYFAII